MVATFDFGVYEEGFRSARGPVSVADLLTAAAHDLGFEQFTIGHHVDPAAPPRHTFQLSNYHPDWVEQAILKRHFEVDPVHIAVMRTAMGLQWSEVPRLLRLSPRQSRILERAQGYGLCAGYTVPFNVPGEPRGSCSFGTRSPERLRRNALPIAASIGGYAFEAMRRLVQPAEGGPAPPPALSQREHIALVRVAQGKNDIEISMMEKIAPSTAHERVENVRRAYGGAVRPYLVARALYDGQISFREIFES